MATMSVAAAMSKIDISAIKDVLLNRVLRGSIVRSATADVPYPSIKGQDLWDPTSPTSLNKDAKPVVIFVTRRPG